MNECPNQACGGENCGLLSTLNNQVNFNLTETPHYEGEKLMPESILLAFITRIEIAGANCLHQDELNNAIKEARMATQLFFHPENKDVKPMPTKQENRGEIGLDVNNGHVAASTTKGAEQVFKQFMAYAEIRSKELGIPIEKVTMQDFLNSHKPVSTQEK